MAKILFANVPAYGHFNPTLPLVSELVGRGHTVDYLITENFRKKVEYCGAKIISYYKPIKMDGVKTLKNVGRIVKEMNKKIIELGDKYDAIIICSVNPYMKDLQKKINKPIICCSAMFFQNEHVMKCLFSKSYGTPAFINFIIKHPIVRRIFSRTIISGAVRSKINDILDVFSPKSSILNIAFTSRYYQPEEEDFVDKCLFIGPTPTICVEDDSFPIKRLENSDKKIIYATLGTVFNTWAGFFKNVIEAFKDSDYLVVMSTGNKDRLNEIGEIPENFIVRDFVPQAEVLKNADLFIAHGGMGSVSDGMSFGVPMILVPLGADQFFNAYRLQELGAGKVLKKSEVTPDNLRHEVESVMKNKLYKEQVKKVQESFISSGGPKRGAREIEKILNSL